MANTYRDKETAIALVSANLRWRVTDGADEDSHRDQFDLTAQAVREDPVGVIIELTQLAATGIWRLADYGRHDPVVLMKEIALGAARRAETDTDDEE